MSDSGVSGSGDLATFTFQVLSQQPTNVTITNSQLYLFDESLEVQPIDHTIDDLVIEQSAVAVTDVSSQISFVQQGFTLPNRCAKSLQKNATSPSCRRVGVP